MSTPLLGVTAVGMTGAVCLVVTIGSAPLYTTFPLRIRSSVIQCSDCSVGWRYVGGEWLWWSGLAFTYRALPNPAVLPPAGVPAHPPACDPSTDRRC
jgi:hypothetical protein